MNKFVVKAWITAFAAMCCAMPLLAQTKSPTTKSSPDILGTYHCEEYASPKEKYDFILTITKTGSTYQLEWYGPIKYYMGTGILSDDKSTVAVAYKKFHDPDPNHVGVEIYKIFPDGSLLGTMGLLGKNMVWQEKCIK